MDLTEIKCQVLDEEDFSSDNLLSQLCNHKYNSLTNETTNDIFLSNALSIDITDSFLKNIDSITNTTATNSTTSTTDTCNGEFLNIEHNSQFLSNNYNPYNNQANDFNELLCDKTFNSFESDLLQTHNFNRAYNILNDGTNGHDETSLMLLRPNNLVNENDYLNIPSNKHDVSIGTDLSISRDLRFKKDINSADHLKLKKPSEKESFKLIEKVPQKKSRTKYSKDQIEVLENAYSRNPYPDVITVEQLCKTLDISREKVNIWFQNRRARTKRNNKIMQDNSSLNNSNNNRTNGYTKFYGTFQHAQQTQIVYNVTNVNSPYYSQQNFIQRPASVVQTNSYPIYANTNSASNTNSYLSNDENPNNNTNNNFCLTATSYDYSPTVQQ